MELTQTVGYRQLIETYWQVGQYLRAEYGKGFNRCNLIYMRLFYLCYPISVMPSHQFSCSHQIELLHLGVGLGGTRRIPSRRIPIRRIPSRRIPSRDRKGAVRNPRVPQEKMGASWN